MTRPADRPGDYHARYGFRWGPMGVTRLAELPDGRRALQIASDGTDDTITVYMSRTGRSVRVFRNGKEMSS